MLNFHWELFILVKQARNIIYYDYPAPFYVRLCLSSCSRWLPLQCSVRCGNGIQKRRVVCAVDNGDTLTVAMESECDAKAKMPLEQPCTATDCSTAAWYSAPFGKVDM